MIETDIRTMLIADAGVSAITTRVYPLHLGQNPRLPAIAYQIVSGDPEYDTEGAAGVARIRLQIDCWAHRADPSRDPYTKARALAEAVRAALSGFSGTVGASDIQSAFLLIRRVLYDDDAALYRESQDWAITYAETESKQGRTLPMNTTRGD